MFYSQVIDDRPEHIYGLPKDVEMFFNPTGREQDIQPMGKEFGVTVYHYESKSDFTFYNKNGDDQNAAKTLLVFTSIGSSLTLDYKC